MLESVPFVPKAFGAPLASTPLNCAPYATHLPVVTQVPPIPWHIAWVLSNPVRERPVPSGLAQKEVAQECFAPSFPAPPAVIHAACVVIPVKSKAVPPFMVPLLR